jgi:malate dehydrogenase
MKDAIQVSVTGAAGNIGYALLWRIASGDCFGPDQPINLQLLEIPQGMERLSGVIMELQDSAFPLVQGIVGTDDPGKAFSGADSVFLVGSRPRSADMDRSDLVAANGPIFVGQGQALNETASRNVRVVTVGNPCNTNCLIANGNSPDLSSSCFSAMTRLDQNRAMGALANQLNVKVAEIRDVFVWGNHSDTMYPDLSMASVAGSPLLDALNPQWLAEEFVPTVATRGKAIIRSRGASSAASAASAAVDHMRDWWNGTDGRVVSMAVPSQGWYGVPEGLVFSFPCRVDAQGSIQVVSDLTVDAHTQHKIEENIAALEGEKAAVSDLL